MTSILIVGAGAVGALFGSALARQGAQVSVVCRSDYDIVAREGYDITSPLLGNHRFYPHEVFREVAECKVPPDFLILTRSEEHTSELQSQSNLVCRLLLE